MNVRLRDALQIAQPLSITQMIEVMPIQCIIWIGTGRAGGRIFVIETRDS